MLNANLIEPMAFAASGASRSWDFALHELDERVAAHEYFADTSARVQAALHGGTDKWQRHFIDVRLHAELALICQRCLHAVPFVLDETVRVLLFTDEAAADAVDGEDEADVLVVTDSADVREWVEDQLLMALPFAPSHDDCGDNDPRAYADPKTNPFSVLRDITPTKR
ncbi:MAG: YceD family protein [Neisseria sp.]|nr:YceD family protein [Neisseria sp.]